MFRLMTLLAGALAVTGCATQKGAEGPVEERQAIKNIVPFDLANCYPPKFDVPKPANEDVLIGTWAAARPLVMECLVDPRSRDKEKDTKVSVTAKLSDEGVQRTVAGTNLTAEGKTCIEDGLAKLPSPAPLPKGKAAISYTGELTHTAGMDPTVTRGVNEISDLAATVRLAEPQMCGCFEPWKGAAPGVLKATLKFTRAGEGKTAAPDITFSESASVDASPATDPATTQVRACVKEKLATLPYTVKSSQVGFTYPFLLLNSSVAQANPDAPPTVQVTQLDSARGQHVAVTAMKHAARFNAASAYETLVKKYKANARSVTIKELRDGCAAMLRADEDYIHTVKREADVERKTVELISQLKAKDASRSDASTAAATTLAATEKEVKAAEAAPEQHKAACPKVSY